VQCAAGVPHLSAKGVAVARKIGQIGRGPPWLVRVYNGLIPGVESPSTDRTRRTFCRENRVSRRLWALPTASRRRQAGNLWISVFKDRTATLSMLSLRPMAEGPIPTRIWIAGSQHFSLAGAVQSPEPPVDAGRELRNGSGRCGSCPVRRRARITWW
jgi:hypothetical protein